MRASCLHRTRRMPCKLRWIAILFGLLVCSCAKSDGGGKQKYLPIDPVGGEGQPGGGGGQAGWDESSGGQAGWDSTGGDGGYANEGGAGSDPGVGGEAGAAGAIGTGGDPGVGGDPGIVACGN